MRHVFLWTSILFAFFSFVTSQVSSIPTALVILGFAILFAVFCRITQASDYHKALMKQLINQHLNLREAMRASNKGGEVEGH